MRLNQEPWAICRATRGLVLIAAPGSVLTCDHTDSAPCRHHRESAALRLYIAEMVFRSF